MPKFNGIIGAGQKKKAGGAVSSAGMSAAQYGWLVVLTAGNTAKKYVEGEGRVKIS